MECHQPDQPREMPDPAIQLAATKLQVQCCLPLMLQGCQIADRSSVYAFKRLAAQEIWKLEEPSDHQAAVQSFKAVATQALKKQLSGGNASASAPAIMRRGADSMGVFSAKIGLDRILWGKAVGDGQQLELAQSLASGALAASAGCCATGSFTALKVRCCSESDSFGGGGGGGGGGMF